MKKIEEKEFKEIAKNILFYIDEVCKKNNINYYLGFGSLLGAVRHKGFIPWDDDIDVCIPRNEYERFIQIMKKDNKYNIISEDNDKDYYFTFARVCDKNTILYVKDMPEIHKLGVFVDIFPLDVTPKDGNLQEYFDKYEELLKKVRNTVPRTAKYRILTFKGFLRNIKNYPKRVKYKPKKFLQYRKELEEHITQYKDTDNENYIVLCAYGLRCVFPRKWFDETADVEFEGKKIKAPKEYDAFLKKVYGDYMKLPPESARHSQHHFVAFYK